MKQDGSERRKLLPMSVFRLIVVSPDDEWIAAWVQVTGEESSVAVQGYRLSDGKAARICVFCSVGWSADGKYLYLSYESFRRANVTAPGKTYAVPLRSGFMLPAPAGGITSEADLVKLGAVVIPINPADDLAPGPSPAIYTFARRTIQRNLYRVPLP